MGSLQSLQIGDNGSSGDSSGASGLQQVEVSVGSYLSIGDNVVLITNPKHIVVQYPVAQSYSSHLAVGQAVSVNVTAYPSRTFKGQVAYISPVVQSTGYVYKVRAKLDNPDMQLKSGMHVMVTQTLQANRETLAVPSLSLMPALNGYQVYTIIDNKVNSNPVTVGNHYDTWVEVTSGLKLGEKIITEGQAKVGPGQPVKIVN